MLKQIPNLLTGGNLIMGCIGITLLFQGKINEAIYCMGIAALFDFFDGFAARALKVSNDIGKELDSLADCISFGVLPSMLVFTLLKNEVVSTSYLPYLAFIMAYFSALRLAKFNLDTRQSDSFIGVPTPANALLWGGYPFLMIAMPEWTFLHNPYFIIGLSLIMSYLLNAELPLFALKFKKYGWKTNEIRYSFIVFALGMAIIFKGAGIPFIVISYILLSVFHNLRSQKVS